MSAGRLEAFSGGVMAILITIMVLGLHQPHGVSFADLRATFPSLLTSIPLAFAQRWVSVGIFLGVAITWFIPDRRLETYLDASLVEEHATN